MLLSPLTLNTLFLLLNVNASLKKQKKVIPTEKTPPRASLSVCLTGQACSRKPLRGRSVLESQKTEHSSDG